MYIRNINLGGEDTSKDLLPQQQVFEFIIARKFCKGRHIYFILSQGMHTSMYMGTSLTHGSKEFISNSKARRRVRAVSEVIFMVFMVFMNL